MRKDSKRKTKQRPKGYQVLAKAIKVFLNQNIKVEIRLPNAKYLDLNDEYDQDEAVTQLAREWLSIDTDVKKFLGLVKLDGKNINLIRDKNQTDAQRALADLRLP